jgi:hypothetical protein
VVGGTVVAPATVVVGDTTVVTGIATVVVMGRVVAVVAAGAQAAQVTSSSPVSRFFLMVASDLGFAHHRTRS